MSEAITRLSNTDLQSLISALRSGRVTAPYSALQLSRCVPASLSTAVHESLAILANQAFSATQIAAVLELLHEDRISNRSCELPIDIVTSGPEAPGITNRDTSVVVRELFAHAQESVLVVGYVVYQGQQVFDSLARRMEQIPSLRVRIFLNIARPRGDRTPTEILVSRFKQHFRDKQWPSDCRLPEIYYDPRSLAIDAPEQSALHAKCVVVDSENVFISSANFTEAAQQRNIEVGLSIRSQSLAEQLLQHFTLLHERNLAMRAL